MGLYKTDFLLGFCNQTTPIGSIIAMYSSVCCCFFICSIYCCLVHTDLEFKNCWMGSIFAKPFAKKWKCDLDQCGLWTNNNVKILHFLALFPHGNSACFIYLDKTFGHFFSFFWFRSVWIWTNNTAEILQFRASFPPQFWIQLVYQIWWIF